jgi:hypothetical protein
LHAPIFELHADGKEKDVPRIERFKYLFRSW